MLQEYDTAVAKAKILIKASSESESNATFNGRNEKRLW